MTTESTVPPPAGRPRAVRPGPPAAPAESAAAAGRGAAVGPPVPAAAFVPPAPPRAAAGAPRPRFGGLRSRADGTGARTGGRPAARRAAWLPLFAVDACAALLGGLVLEPGRRHPLLLTLLLLAVTLLNARGALYRPALAATALDELPAVCGRVMLGWCVLAAVLAAHAPAAALPASTLAAGCALHAAAGCLGRAAVHGARRRALVRRPRAALVVGSAAAAQRVAAAFLRRPRCGVRPVGVVAGHDAGGAPGLPVLTTEEEVRQAVARDGVRSLLAVGPDGVERALLLRSLGAWGCEIWEVRTDPGTDAPPEWLAGFSCRRLPDHVPGRAYGDGSGHACGNGNGHPYNGGTGHPYGSGCDGVAKRVLDVLGAGALLVAAGPLLLLCAAGLRLTAGPGVLFRQERIGKGGQPFTLLKFRTHRPADAHEAATRWSVADERGMGRFCRFLRRTSLDELPQLWNVLRGDMSLVGPRPERPHFVHRFGETYPGYAARHRTAVGITGLAQVNGLRGDTSIEDRCRFDNAYIDTWSLWRDVCILLRTAASLVRPAGS
ncbi:transferase [Streptomyces minutiscleroticus]|uniref:Transferase n=2 Tax=Streptomyces minutiscleroticus TaxID=68238 RepID=A0A918KJH5_9ACTN|nr:transferase [Streptomyces minutiscleroticus]